ncbi:alpha/beta hydrolase [Isoptericola sp. S6320L]|uniref:alpha/beta fold hydrolase n=1 Tax=Isoptericola sp. S6320L TaxID=2926411 RepID=UPI001FF5418B|nr:alpha/beta fold hydrolase [Isoptericola sp. S6320L]MCK0115622.1 alpha/beta hydrolase [Isoptericola sp. S6320L]
MPIVPPPVRTGFRLLGTVAPPLATALGVRAMRRVGPPARVRPVDAEVHDAARRGSLDIDGERVATYAWGDAAAPPVLLVHGWQLRASRLARLVEAFLAAGLRPVAFDGVAHGDSTGRRTQAVQHARVLRAVQEQAGPALAVVGHSLGAMAAGLALRDGLAADRLVAIAAPTGFESVIGSFVRQSGIPPRLHDRLAERAARVMFPDVGAPRTELDLTRHPVPPGVPTLFVQSTTDSMNDPDNARRLHAAHPGSEMLVAPGLGHNRVLDDPEVLRAVVDHVTATRPTGAAPVASPAWTRSRTP